MRLLYPPVCVVCGRMLADDEEHICLTCRFLAPVTGYCEKPYNPLFESFLGRVPLQSASAMLFYETSSPWRRLIHDFKYHDRWALAEEMGRWYGRLLKQSGYYNTIEVVVPLPLHPLRFLMRGYNQSYYLARGIAEALEAEVDTRSVKRVRYTRPQARMRRRDREKNVASAFRVVNPAALEGRHILLVDDVLTTGNTLEACANAIMEAQVTCKISIAVLATPPPRPVMES